MREHRRHSRRRPKRSDSFRCQHCRIDVPLAAPGTAHRNHCPQCLWSAHLDERPGDRRAGCGGGMEPIAVWVRPDGEWALVHRCGRCKVTHTNRVAGDDNAFALMSLAAKPLANPPFPVDRIPR